LFDFAISFFGILAVLFVNSIQTWAALGAAAMIMSMIRCGLSWQDAKNKNIKNTLKRILAVVVFVSVLFFVVYASIKANVSNE
jgi:predicted membrane-bound dolichyl-phosphate-mannose-protein mannosyltransferase